MPFLTILFCHHFTPSNGLKVTRLKAINWRYSKLYNIFLPWFHHVSHKGARGLPLYHFLLPLFSGNIMEGHRAQLLPEQGEGEFQPYRNRGLDRGWGAKGPIFQEKYKEVYF